MKLPSIYLIMLGSALAAPGDYLFEREAAGSPRWPKQHVTPQAGHVLGWSGTGAAGSLTNVDVTDRFRVTGDNVATGVNEFHGTTRFAGPVVFNLGSSFAFDTNVAGLFRSAAGAASAVSLNEKADDLAGVQNINSNFTLADSHLGKLLIISGNRTMTLPMSGVRPGRFAIYVEGAGQLTVDGLLLGDTSGGAYETTDGYVEIQLLGSYWVADIMGRQTTVEGMSGTMAQFDTAVSNGNLVYQNQPITPTAITETVVPWGIVTSGATLSVANGTVLTATLTASTACTFTMPAAVAGKRFTLYLKQAASTGNGSATFSGVKWPGAAPVITTTAGRMDILTFCSDGTNWYGSAVQNYTP
ncbi:MAG: hypothetical protein EOP86_20650 [Verrucomicrobiaceae bacterium]|nr:MAG: hypothetical protein EOP86_20650 [Verrucomicrobiaceae bacterium]